MEQINTNIGNQGNNITAAKKLVLLRESYTKKDGTSQYEYIVKGLIRGKEVKVGFLPKVNKVDKTAKWQSDGRSYQVLDFVFGDKDRVDLIIEDKERLDEKTGELIPYCVYTAYSKDGLGEYECDVKPILPSDKALLQMILKQKSVAEAEKAATGESPAVQEAVKDDASGDKPAGESKPA